MNIYVDLDNTLINPVVDSERNVLGIIPRPGVSWFLRNLSNHGEIRILSAARIVHIKNALDVLGKDAKYVKEFFGQEDLAPLEDEMLRIAGQSTPWDEKVEEFRKLPPIAPAGIMFDDAAVDSGFFILKSAALGIDETKWITVEPFSTGSPDRQGLKKAYSEFITRFHEQELGRVAWA